MNIFKKLLKFIGRAQNVLAALLSLLLFTVVFYFLNYHVPGFVSNHQQVVASFSDFKEYIQSFALLAYPLYIGGYFLGNSLFLPVFILSLLGGLIFNPLIAALAGLVALSFSMQTYYWLARLLGRKFATWFGFNEILAALEQKKDLPFFSLLSFRLNFFLPLHPFSAFCGTLRVPYFRFLASTTLGLAPQVFVITLLGYGIARGGNYLTYAIILWILLVCLQSVFGYFHLRVLLNKAGSYDSQIS